MSSLLSARLALACLMGLSMLQSARAAPVISEVLYDAVGSDNGALFVELYGAPGESLAGLSLQGVNGANGAVYLTLNLAGVMPPDGVFVLADDSGDGTTPVPEADLILNFDFQNGPDSILLKSGDAVLDAVGYGVFGPTDIFAGEGSPAPGAAAGEAIARRFANVDTNDNAVDFLTLVPPTPGFVDLYDGGQSNAVPLPASVWLLVSGGIGLIGVARRARIADPQPM